jgi:hypothetical protein
VRKAETEPSCREQAQRASLCYDREAERRQKKHRAELRAHLEAELAVLQDLDSSSYTERVFELVASRRYGRYLRRTSTGKLRLGSCRRRTTREALGKLAVRSNDDRPSAEDMALGYK